MYYQNMEFGDYMFPKTIKVLNNNCYFIISHYNKFFADHLTVHTINTIKMRMHGGKTVYYECIGGNNRNALVL